MELIVYMDLVFLVSVVMDFIILFIMKELLHETAAMLRLSLAAIIASFGSCILIMFSIPVAFRFICLYGIVSTVILKIAFSIKNKKDYIIKLFTFFGVAFFVDGFLDFFRNHLSMERYYGALLQGTIFERISVIRLIAGIGCLIVCYPIVAFLVCLVKEKVLLLRNVKMVHHGLQIKATALLDTGNMLFDPLSGEPVIIAEFSLVRKLFTPKQQLKLVSYMEMNRAMQEGYKYNELSEEEPVRFRMIPFHSVGKESGMLVAVRLDLIMIGEQSGWKRREKVLIGLYPGRLSAKESYQVILHSDLI
ncbi:sigma-E processing peptidase SpoIIGA [[Clostridium] polysaccharolyticum]|uniref:Sporulation sigma-E factor-processing peptidase n=1 Tax=[Clostridium] polysaccharolyticum TaxID=29364 RepID=A0A1H9Y155_9FIRM|nr:sigma-E processing peptidase SpoIIGA [[Clostridium] polysaccharolyticum]SES62487.1 stage II sporulation protein GA (sporulation sigma-E factor processing peptidase) [[Clostridium] polysaccharolyticum]